MEDIDRICGRRPNPNSSDGFDYALKHKGISYLHLEWVTRQQLDLFNFKKNVVINRFLKRLQESDEDPNTEILLVPSENFLVDSVIDCADAIIEINPALYLTGWRLLGPEEEIPRAVKIQNLPPTWRQRLGEPEEKEPIRGNMLDELAGENPFLHLYKDISRFYPPKSAKGQAEPDIRGSVYQYERIYFVKWMDLSLSEATWERACDINVPASIEFHVGRREDPAVRRLQHHSPAVTRALRRLSPRELPLFPRFSVLRVALFLPRPPPDHPTSVPVVQQITKGKRGRPRKSVAPRRRNGVRMCIEPNVPVVDRSACRKGDRA